MSLPIAYPWTLARCATIRREFPSNDDMTTGVSRGIPEAGFLPVLRGAALIAVLAGAGGSVAMMLHVGRRQQSRILLLLFGVWVLSPFVSAVAANSVSKHWAVVIRATLYVVMVVLTLGSLAIYGYVAFEHAKVKIGFVFLVVPLASWLLTVIVVGTAALISGRQSRRGKSG